VGPLETCPLSYDGGMSENIPTISIPVRAEDLKRGDHIRLCVQFQREVDMVDVRVTGTKNLPADTECHPRVRINVVHPDGRRESLMFLLGEGNTEGHYARSAVQSGPPSGVFVEDEAGDIAYCSGNVGAWVRLCDRWSTRPTIWEWKTEGRRKWKLLEEVVP